MTEEYAYPLHLVAGDLPGTAGAHLTVTDHGDLPSALKALWDTFFRDLQPVTLCDADGKLIVHVNRAEGD